MNNSIYLHNSHNISNLVYHFVFPTKYRRVVFDEHVDLTLKQICEGIALRYDWIRFLKIGVDQDRLYFLIQLTPNYSPTKITITIKRITSKCIFVECPEVKKQLWGGQF